MTDYVRQHYKLATTGTPGQSVSGKAAGKSGKSTLRESTSKSAGSSRSSGSKKSGY